MILLDHMIDIVLSPKTAEFDRVAALLGIALWHVGTEVAFCPKQAKLTIADGQDSQLRSLIEKGRANAVIGLEASPAKDGMHSRRSGLNQVLANIITKKKGIVLFDHGMIRTASPQRRAQLLGRMRQNVELCRKYNVRMAIVTMAKTPLQLRSPADLRSFAMQLGMSPGEAKAAVSAVGETFTKYQK